MHKQIFTPGLAGTVVQGRLTRHADRSRAEGVRCGGGDDGQPRAAGLAACAH